VRTRLTDDVAFGPAFGFTEPGASERFAGRFVRRSERLAFRLAPAGAATDDRFGCGAAACRSGVVEKVSSSDEERRSAADATSTVKTSSTQPPARVAAMWRATDR
jgi:hypothetical protein